MPNACYLPAIHTYYPKAVTSTRMISILYELIHTQFGLNPCEILHADSVCSDDINTLEYPKKAYEMIGPFKMGGLNGFPFCGLTGMNALAHHIPDNGASLIVYGPHIGISRDLEFGQIHRPGQRDTTHCCGALSVALQKVLDEQGITHISYEDDDLDYQQHLLEQILRKSKDRIASAKSPLHEATQIMYEAIGRRIDVLLEKTNFPCNNIIIAGGIMINGDPEMGSFFELQRLDFINSQTRKIDDFSTQFFQKLNEKEEPNV